MHRLVIVAAPFLAAASLAAAQDAAPPAPPAPTSTTTSARDLLEALRAAGVDVSSVATINEDGSVTVKLPAPPEPAPGAPTPATDAPAAPTEAAPPGAPPTTEQSPAPEAAKWDHKLTIGFGFSNGNTENANVDALYSFTRELSWSRLAFDTGYFYSEDAGRSSENQFTVGINHDWLFLGTPWLLFADARYDYDEFQSWRHRISGHVGPGYKLINTEKVALTLRAGVGAVKEWLSDNDGWRMEGLAGFDFEWKLTKAQSLTTNFRLFPNFDEWSEYRTTTFAGWQMNIDKADGLALTLGLFHEYQSVVDPGRDQHDTRLFGGVTFDF